MYTRRDRVCSALTHAPLPAAARADTQTPSSTPAPSMAPYVDENEALFQQMIKYAAVPPPSPKQVDMFRKLRIPQELVDQVATSRDASELISRVLEHRRSGGRVGFAPNAQI